MTFDASHNPGGYQYLGKRLQFARDEAYRIKGRPLLGMEGLWTIESARKSTPTKMPTKMSRRQPARKPRELKKIFLIA